MVIRTRNIKTKRKYFNELIIVVLAIILLSQFTSFSFFRVDLTTEKRFSISNSSREILRGLDDVVYVRVYLDGELPNDLVHFRENIKESLIEFRAYAGKNLEFEFINLYDEKDIELRNKMMGDLADKGLKVTDIQHRDSEGGLTTKIIFPGAIFSFRNVDFPVNLLKNNPALPYRENIANSVQSLEYEFIRAIKSITNTKIEKVAFIEGHGEFDFWETYDISSELSLFFQVDRGVIGGNLENVLDYKALIIARPTTRFSEADKFVLDQYLMNGGKLLFFLDPVEANEDSLISGQTYTKFRDLNIYDLLFKYGVRVSYNLVKDFQCNYKRIQTSVNNQEPRTTVLPWWYSPLVTASSENIITKGLNYIKTDYVSAIDTTAGQISGLKRTVLLSSSDTSALINNPVYISMDEVTRPPDRSVFVNSSLALAILSEGEFPSFYRNYSIPSGVAEFSIPVLNSSKHTSVFVSGDADIIRNDVHVQNNQFIPQPLGYDRDTRQTFGNKEFIMNVVNYMCDDMALISLRSREYKLRLLDVLKLRKKQEKLKWILINTLLPVLIIVLIGWLYNLRRKLKYSKKYLKI
ncbi:MAG: gliding motility-associated ABC transporter substrate-binding protein GldG [Bacteroidales bacterium]|nr:gliding motility-associated ABC transporter substrate-binding protein GldG [Bacteroidales bacterium]